MYLLENLERFIQAGLTCITPAHLYAVLTLCAHFLTISSPVISDSCVTVQPIICVSVRQSPVPVKPHFTQGRSAAQSGGQCYTFHIRDHIGVCSGESDVHFIVGGFT